MKLSDLMIGDWVYVEKVGKPVRVESVGYTAFVGYEHFQEIDGSIYGIKPIELTEEILEKNGFGFLDTSNNEIKSVWTGWWILDGFELGCFCNLKFPVYFNISDVNVKVNYVHELQHALKLCGIEKEIVL